MGRLDGKVCVITGAASGIGADTAQLFSEEGASVVGVDLSPDAMGDLALQADVTDEAQVRGFYARAREEYGRIDVLFNNAGINPTDDTSVLSTDVEAWQRVQDVNVRSVFLCCKHGIPQLLEAGGGSVINMASFVAVTGRRGVADLLHGVEGRGVIAVSRAGGGVRPAWRARQRAVSRPGRHPAAPGAVCCRSSPRSAAPRPRADGPLRART